MTNHIIDRKSIVTKFQVLKKDQDFDMFGEENSTDDTSGEENSQFSYGGNQYYNQMDGQNMHNPQNMTPVYYAPIDQNWTMYNESSEQNLRVPQEEYPAQAHNSNGLNF